MDDKELLELAAKAAGLDVARWDGKLIINPQSVYSVKEWNPLTDDGDALRLAVKLQIHPEIFNGYTIAQYPVKDPEDWNSLEVWGDNPYAATRRAIVRAAAALAK
jgi:hypothetical protein